MSRAVQLQMAWARVQSRGNPAAEKGSHSTLNRPYSCPGQKRRFRVLSRARLAQGTALLFFLPAFIGQQPCHFRKVMPLPRRFGQGGHPEDWKSCRAGNLASENSMLSLLFKREDMLLALMDKLDSSRQWNLVLMTLCNSSQGHQKLKPLDPN